MDGYLGVLVSRTERLYGTQDTDPITSRVHPNVLENAVIQVRQDIPAYCVFRKRFGVLAKANGVEPFPETCHDHSAVARSRLG